ncbi:hypothetical protein BS78_08G063100 [Paspalum vaginatum]|nr:hypothetical protein BS78_08G063100 [Paspalum vaginatum]KAJ1265227.1 hypothetical protein BS78_08G063100 [Paspalum vaginatum]KAJ1265228.1 hypothetical protein BS78_08G063100 [Paspalum vaginatum]KAJ1265229.1 hypothetical protein BS78_08G063100 [Paspalum vaginatum]
MGMAMETEQIGRDHRRPRRQQGRRQAVVVVSRQGGAAADGLRHDQSVPPSPKSTGAGGLSAEAFLVLACVAVSLIVLPLVLPPLPPPPPLLLLVPVCLLLLLAALATFVPSDVKTMACS